MYIYVTKKLLIMSTTISHNLYFAHPPERVWEYLTQSALMEQWLMPNDFLPILGYEFQFRTRPLPQMNLDGIFHCKVLEIVPYRKLTYSWKAGPGNQQFTLDSVVYWTLRPKEGGTELFLEHSGFRELEHFTLFNAMNEGWLKNIKKIDDHLNKDKNAAANP